MIKKKINFMLNTIWQKCLILHHYSEKMHTIEPFYRWRNRYTSEEDPLSPFYGMEYSEFQFSNTVYNYFIHPQWDEFGSATLYLKIIYADYEMGFAIIELIGEWNDCLYNDVMFLKRNVIDVLVDAHINRFLLIGENVFNFHFSDDSYYHEWFEDIEEGWIVGLNFRQHVISEFRNCNIHHYIFFPPGLLDFNWRKYEPGSLFQTIEGFMYKKLSEGNIEMLG